MFDKGSLPAANEVVKRSCFYTCLSVHGEAVCISGFLILRGGSAPRGGVCLSPGWGVCATHPPLEPLKRTACILLGCFLVDYVLSWYICDFCQLCQLYTIAGKLDYPKRAVHRKVMTLSHPRMGSFCFHYSVKQC